MAVVDNNMSLLSLGGKRFSILNWLSSDLLVGVFGVNGDRPALDWSWVIVNPLGMDGLSGYCWHSQLCYKISGMVNLFCGST